MPSGKKRAKSTGKHETAKPSAARRRTVAARASSPEVDKLLGLAAETGAGATEMTEARVRELVGRWGQLELWGVASKLTWTKETQKDIASFLEKAAKGDIDTTQIVGVTADITRLEKEARDWDLQRKAETPFKPVTGKTPFDIERSTESLSAAKSTVEAAKDVGAVAADFGKSVALEVQSAARSAVGGVPLWLIGVVVVGGGFFALSKLTQAADVGLRIADTYQKNKGR